MNIAWCIALLLVSSLNVVEAKVEFTASASSNPVVVGQQFQISFTLVNGATRSIEPPEFDGLTFVSGPQVMQSTQNYNGRLSSSQEFVYVVKAKKEGAVVIGPASCIVDGKKFKTEPIKIQVVPKSQQQLARERALQKEIADNVFIEASASKQTVYQGEQVFLSYRFFTSMQFGDQDFNEPSFKNLWLEKLETESRGVQVQHDGKRMVRFDLVRALAFPQRSGELRIDPYTADVTVRVPDKTRQSRDMFGFRRQQYKDESLTLRSGALTLNVLPLPSQGKPSGFDGVVGEYTVTMSADKPEAAANDAITVRVTYEGRGNLKLIDAPELSVPSDIEVYDPKVVDNISVTSSGMRGKRVFEYVLIPRRSGVFTVEANDISWFDPKKKQYQELTSSELQLSIGKGDGSAPSIVSTPSRRENVEIVGEDIRFLKTIDASSLQEIGAEPFMGSPAFYVLGILPLPLVFALLGYRRSRGKELSNSQRVALAGKQFHKQAKHMGNKGAVEYKNVDQVVREYISNKFSLPLGEQNDVTISNTLSDHGVREPHIAELKQVLMLCSMSQYAPSTEQTSPNAVLDRAISLVNSMEAAE